MGMMHSPFNNNKTSFVIIEETVHQSQYISNQF